MTSWRDPILAAFTPDIAAVSRLTVVADPDELLTEPGIIEGIRGQGFELITFDDHAAFRYAYERRFRRLWDEGRATNLVVVLRAARAEVDDLPYDLLSQARREHRLLSFSLVDLFPKLQPHAVSELERGDLDSLYAAQEAHPPEQPLGLNSTRDFLLRHVFEIVPEVIKAPSDLLRVLLRRHYSGRVLPQGLDEHLITQLRKTGRWDGWPLERIVPSRADFLQFLQERWVPFVERKLDSGGMRVAEPKEPYGLKVPGPVDLPFDHDDVRVYIDNLFIEGMLAPTAKVARDRVDGTWMTVGVAGSPVADRHERLARLLGVLDQDFPREDAKHHAWLQLAQRWSEAVALRMALAELDGEAHASFDTMHSRVEAGFQAWMAQHYASLATLPALPRPVMLHHVTRFLSHGMGTAKRALVVVDGLSLDQWAAVRDELPSRWSIEDGAVFAWVPTLTSVSRQSIFAGDPPFYFAPTIESTHKEPKHWARFWEDRGLAKSEIAYVCQKDLEDDDTYLSRIREEAEHPKCRALAIVVGTIDQMLHGIVTGTDGLHASVRHWGQRGALDRLLSLLGENGFDIYLTADHGNVEGTGIGKPNVGATAEQRGERVHVFRDELTRSGVAAKYPGTISWPSIGLPEDYLALIAPPRRAFIHEGKRAVSHGGLCIEEVVVPFARITRSG